MTIEPREFLMNMKEHDFVYDMKKLSAVFNRNHEEDKEYVFKILDLLYENYDRVKYIDDMSEKYTGKDGWAVLISQKFAMADKRIPIPQAPFHIKINGKNDISMKAKIAYMLLIGFLKETDEPIHVSLNFKDEVYRKTYKQYVKENVLVY
ncbi:hypothetical protein [Heyndrickxia camelliae]|uniref:Uncharacterized protein n=1 Tax=Heyndrickxia camelliae TaxID=1707093 RepID=A0A2N3LEC1_9BACI|nr:hypothetical protein [Heyndrickxia camelliae]PKR82893.1 hypothetical protein CWO92_22140 [Heyndrickxia camelliae]